MKRLVVGLALLTASFAVLAQTSSPVWVGSQIAGTFGDATGHSAQSHLVYAANSNVWWVFTLTSSADSPGGTNHLVKSFHSSGPDLATATWIAGADSPPAVAGQSNDFMGGGRALGVAYLDNAPIDVIHADISMAFDGQNGRTGHIRARVTGTTITWESWNYFDEPAAVWTLPRGNAVGVSTGRFIHTGGPILQQEVDANARKSTTADTGGAWTAGFSVPSVIDGTMLNAANVLAFAPLASDVMLAVYDNGQATEPNLTNLRYTKSNANGSWPSISVGTQTGGDGNVFSTNATIDQNDWSLVPVSTAEIYAFRRTATGAGVNGAKYNVATNNWSAFSPAPPPFGAGQAAKRGAGLFGATDHNGIWLFVINTDAANSILYTTFDGTQWTAWATVPGTAAGAQARNFISGYQSVASNQIGLIWTEGTTIFDVTATSLIVGADTTPPTVSMIAPAAGATLFDTVSVAASASDNIGVAGVQFTLDGTNLGAELTTTPYAIDWNTIATPNGSHALAAVVRDAAGNTTTAAAVTVTVNNDLTPPTVSITAPADGATVGGSSIAVSATATDNVGVVGVQFQLDGLSLGTELTAAPYSLSWNTFAATAGSHALTAVARDAAGRSTTSTAITVSVSNTTAVPNVVGLTQAAATASITSAGLAVGAVTTASSTTVPAGSVISQTPIAGTQVATASAVALVVSSGLPPVAVPNVVGLTQAAATTTITGSGLAVGAVTTASSTTVPAGSAISQTPIAGTQVATGSAVALVVSSGAAAFALAVDKVVFSDGAGVRTTPAFSTAAAGELLVAFAASAGPNSTSSKQTLTVAGAGLTWTLAKRANAQFGSSEVWTAVAPVPLVNATVTATQTAAGFDQSLTVVAFVGASGAGATGAASASFGPSIVPVTTTQAGSFVYGVGNDSARPAARTLGPSQTLTHQWVDFGTNQTFWVQSLAGAVPNAGTVATINDTAPTSDRWNIASVEILAAGSPQGLVGVPNVVGLTQAAAASAIAGVGLSVGTVTTTSSATVPSGEVISQSPVAGTPVVTGSAVAFVVSSGPPSVATPNVVGLTQAAASSAIAGVGLAVGAITTASSSTVPSGAVISQSPVAGTPVATGSAVAFVVSSGQLSGVDTIVFSDGTDKRVTPPFSTAAAGELLLAFVASDGITGTGQTATVSGAGLTWTLVSRANVQSGTAEIWSATAPAQLVNVTVSATQGFSGRMNQSLTVVAFTGTAGVGASAVASGSRIAPSVSLTTTGGGSLVYAVGNDPIRKIARTPGVNQTILHQWVDTDSNQTLWVQSPNGPVATAGSVATINDTAPVNGDWNLAAVEIVFRQRP